MHERETQPNRSLSLVEKLRLRIALRKLGRDPSVEPTIQNFGVLAVPDLISTLQGKDFIKQERAAAMLGGIKDSRAIRPLREHLANHYSPQSAWALGEMRAEEAIAILTSRLNEKEPSSGKDPGGWWFYDTIDQSALALAKIGGDNQLSSIIAFLDRWGYTGGAIRALSEYVIQHEDLRALEKLLDIKRGKLYFPQVYQTNSSLQLLGRN